MLVLVVVAWWFWGRAREAQRSGFAWGLAGGSLALALYVVLICAVSPIAGLSVDERLRHAVEPQALANQAVGLGTILASVAIGRVLFRP